MGSEQKFFSFVSACVMVGFISLCVAAKGCNDANNATKKLAIDKGCIYFGAGKYYCK